jgi:hypothetical protein
MPGPPSARARRAPTLGAARQVELLRVLLEAIPSAVPQWLARIFATPGFSCGKVAAQGQTTAALTQLLAQQPPLSTADFQSVLQDFSRICRGKLGADSLDRYTQAAASPGALRAFP